MVCDMSEIALGSQLPNRCEIFRPLITAAARGASKNRIKSTRAGARIFMARLLRLQHGLPVRSTRSSSFWHTQRPQIAEFFLLPDKIVCFMALRMVFDVLEVKQRRPLRESVLHCSSHLHNSFTRRCPSQMHHLGPSGFHS